MAISVVVPFYNAEPHIEDCTRHLLAQDHPREATQIIMVDNNSGDRSAAIVERYAGEGVVLLREPKQGAYAARNRGVARADGDIIAFTDPDCLPAPDWLRTVDRALADPGTDIVLGSHLPGGESFLLALMVGYMNERSRYVLSSDDRELYYGYTNNMAVRARLFDELGPFRERRRGADTLFVQRYLESHPCAGVLYHPGMRVRHLELESVRQLYRKFFIYARSRKRYRPIARVRPLTNRERVVVFRDAARNLDSSIPETLVAFLLLAVGAGFWYLGDLVTPAARAPEEAGGGRS